VGVTQRAASLGVGQSWQDVTASRALATLYTNNSGKPIQLMVIAPNAQLQINGQVMYMGSMIGTNWNMWIVPVGATYWISATSMSAWWELR
jgi:hypothetical protein